MQRYEREMSLPTHRPAGKSSGAVFAIQSELDNWITTGPGRVDSVPMRRALSHRTNRLRVSFLLVDSEIALTFSGIALSTSDPEKKTRTAQTARKAYDTIMRMGESTNISDADREKLDANLRRLKSDLERLGGEL